MPKPGKNEDPAEGSRATIDRELERQTKQPEQIKKPGNRPKPPDRKGQNIRQNTRNTGYQQSR
jgi:hypothetical protein